jgi:hypothetical protein
MAATLNLNNAHGHMHLLIYNRRPSHQVRVFYDGKERHSACSGAVWKRCAPAASVHSERDVIEHGVIVAYSHGHGKQPAACLI